MIAAALFEEPSGTDVVPFGETPVFGRKDCGFAFQTDLKGFRLGCPSAVGDHYRPVRNRELGQFVTDEGGRLVIRTVRNDDDA